MSKKRMASWYWGGANKMRARRLRAAEADIAEALEDQIAETITEITDEIRRAFAELDARIICEDDLPKA